MERNGRKRWLTVFLVTFLFFVSFAPAALAGQTGTGEGEGGAEDVQQELDRELSSYDFGEIDQVLREALGGEEISFGQVVGQLAQGNFAEFFRLLASYVDEALFGELRTGRNAAWQILLLAVMGAVFANLTRAFPDGQVSQTGFYILYTVLAVLLLTAFGTAVSVAAEAFSMVGSLMNAFLPVFFVAVAIQGQLTAAAMYEFTLLLIRAVQWFFENIAVQGVKACVVLRLLEGLFTEDFLSRLTGLLYSLLKWSVKAVFGLAVGFQTVQALLLPYMDAVKGGALLKLASLIPGVGNGVETAAQMALGTAALVRNGIGVAGVFALVLVSLGPLCKLLFFALLYHGLAAVLQPVSDKRIPKAVAAVGEGCALLLKIMGGGILLFAIAVGVACACFGRVG